ncbi:MAG: c-type cytochrome [Caldimonas sp.]
MGESIYRRGVTGSGAPVEASRAPGATVTGAAVACINCHRRSGLGSKEGRTLIPPIASRYLFHARIGGAAELDLPFAEGSRVNREPYTEATLARAIRDGIDSQGQPLSYLMPRFALGDADMAALSAYLKRLDRHKVPGVTESELHFATIITPDADPDKRRGMLDVLKHFFADRNATQRDPTPPMLTSGRTTFSKMMFKVNRHWELHVWELSGPESTWREQLERKLAKEPVLAVISGLGGSNWAPVHAFCERAELPCLFPNVEAPPGDADHDFYTLYFSRGVLLEADLIGEELLDSKARAVRKVRQIYRAGDVGEAGARRLATALQKKGLGVADRVLARGTLAGEGLAEALRDLADDETLVLWLRSADLAALPAARRPPPSLFVSGLMGGLERAPLPPTWRTATRMAYPFDLPAARRVRVDFARGWFSIKRIPVVAEQVQADTYLACGLLSETVKHMIDNFVRDYLLERFEDTLERRIVTGYYPRLTLASGQRFASKGGYLVRFGDAPGSRLLPEHAWTVP